MNTLRRLVSLIAWVLVALFVASCSSPGGGVQKGVASRDLGEDLGKLVFDPNRFVAALGQNVVVVAGKAEGGPPVEDRIAPLRRMIADAKRTPEPRLFLYPENEPLPELLEKPARLARPPGGPDAAAYSASFVVLVNAKGSVVAMHCWEKNNVEWALDAAKNLRQFRYSPAMVGPHAVPFVFFITMTFTREAT